ncbi:hypothetical protein [Peristeroidobacter soli]|jgi:hypothetical protein|uniref:hypothetical protein n=1 Tax=Peristeroidobacter soli TaxID=2497877 RepID=UPI00101DF8FF|nr:hypothetical protein [Peristeroidobacter soli]
MRILIAAAAAVLCTACVSAPQNVREQASSAFACDASQVKVQQTVRHYMGDYAFEAEGCGQKLTYECEQAYVLLIPVGTLACHRK